MNNYVNVDQRNGRHKIKKSNYYLKAPTQFLGKIHIILSLLIIISSIITIILIYNSLHPDEPSEYEYDEYKRGIIFYLSSITLVSSIVDVGLSFLLVTAAAKVNLQLCNWWWSATLTLFVLYGLFTVAFCVMTESYFLVLTMVPSTFFKPFALWIVDGFMFDLEIEANSLDATKQENNKRTTLFILTENRDGRPRLPKLQMLNQ